MNYNTVATQTDESPEVTFPEFPTAQIDPQMFTDEWTTQMEYDWQVSDLIMVWASGYFPTISWMDLWASKVARFPELADFPVPPQPGAEVFTPFVEDRLAASDYIDQCYG